MKGTEILFDPPLNELEGMLNRLVTVIVESGQDLPRVHTVCILLASLLTRFLCHSLAYSLSLSPSLTRTLLSLGGACVIP